MEAERLARILGSEKAAVFGDGSSIFGLSKEFAEELCKFIENLIKEEEFFGYAIVNGESLVFRKKEGEFLIAFVEDDKLMGSLRKLGEI